MTVRDKGVPNSDYRWIVTGLPRSARYDDIWFIDSECGWAVGSDHNIWYTRDGGARWTIQHPTDSYLRSIAMLDNRVGWVGSMSSEELLFATECGEKWHEVALPVDDLHAICGLWALPGSGPGDEVVFAVGTNFPFNKPYFLKGTKRGTDWTVVEMSQWATTLVDVRFEDEQHGYVLGAAGHADHPRRSDLYTVFLETTDGGATWSDMLGRSGLDTPLGEWGWKMDFVDDDFWVLSSESRTRGAVYITDDRGKTWKRQEIRDADGREINFNLEGVGFLDRQTGWVGGWGDRCYASGRTSRTSDGGLTWTDVTDERARWHGPPSDGCDHLAGPHGQYINRFRFLRGAKLVGYAAGNTVYKYTDEPISDVPPRPRGISLLPPGVEALFYTDEVTIPVTVPAGAQTLKVDVFDRFAGHVRTLRSLENPPGGLMNMVWNLREELADSDGRWSTGQFIVTVQCDEQTDSLLLAPAPENTSARNILKSLLSGGRR